MSGATKKSTGWTQRLLAVFVILFIAHGALWFYASGKAKESILAWVEGQRDAGVDISHDEIKMRGYPFLLDAHAPQVNIQEPSGGQWQSEKIIIRLLPTKLNQLSILPRGKQNFSEKSIGKWSGTFETLELILANDPTRLWTAKLAASGAVSERANSDQKFLFDHARLFLSPNLSDTDQLDLEISSSNISLETNGNKIEAPLLDAFFSLTQTQALSEVFPARSWSENGGQFLIERFKCNIESADLTFTGAISLDRNGSLDGTVNAEIKNPGAVARVLEKTGALPKSQADSLASALTLSSIAQGGKISAPLIFDHGILKIMGIQIRKLPPIQDAA